MSVFQGKTTEYVYVRRLKDGKVMDIPADMLKETLKHGFELTVPVEERKVEVEIKIECPICGYVAKTDHGLKIHKAKHV